MRKTKVEAGDGVDNEEYIKINIKIAKNRLAGRNPYLQTAIFARYGKGIDKSMEILELAIEQGILGSKAGGNFYYTTESGEELKWRGRKNLIEFFDENLELAAELESKINAKLIQGNSLSDEEIEQIEKYNSEVAEEVSTIIDEETELTEEDEEKKDEK